MKCKTGDLAFIKKALRKENIGRVVTCTKYLGYFERGATIVINGEHWKAFDSDDYWEVTGRLETQFGVASQAYIMDSWLSPISPLDDSEEDSYSSEDDLALVE